MKSLLVFLLIVIGAAYSDPLVLKQPKPHILEVKILEKLFRDMLRKEHVVIYILGDRKEYFEKNISEHSKAIRIARSCRDADMVLVAGMSQDIPSSCRDKLVFSTRREHILKWEKCVGAFYWKKGRPNITLIRERLREAGIELPKEYERFIESLEKIGMFLKDGRT